MKTIICCSSSLIVFVFLNSFKGPVYLLIGHDYNSGVLSFLQSEYFSWGKHPEGRLLQTSSLCRQPGSSSQFLSKLEALWALSCVILKLYWALGFNWDGTGYHAAARQLAGPVAGGSLWTNWWEFNSPSPLCVCSNELVPWFGRLHCWYPCCVFVTLTKKALLLIVSHGAPELSVFAAFPVPRSDPPPLPTIAPSSQFDRSFLFNRSTSKRCCDAP